MRILGFIVCRTSNVYFGLILHFNGTSAYQGNRLDHLIGLHDLINDWNGATSIRGCGPLWVNKNTMTNKTNSLAPCELVLKVPDDDPADLQAQGVPEYQPGASQVLGKPDTSVASRPENASVLAKLRVPENSTTR